MAGRCAERCVCEGTQLLAFLVPFWSEVPFLNQIGCHSHPLCLPVLHTLQAPICTHPRFTDGFGISKYST